MSSTFKTEQEEFWAGEFGNEYISRNNYLETIGARTVLFSKIFTYTKAVSSILEIGANIGLNLLSIKNLSPSCKCSAIEINPEAVK